MKKFLYTALACMMLFAIVGCQKKEENVTVIMSMSNFDGNHQVQIEAVGKTVKKITQTSSLEVVGYSEDQIREIVADMQSEHEVLENGLTFSVEYKDSSIVKTYTLDATNKEAIEAANGYAFFTFAVNTKKITLNKYIEDMKGKGFTVTEEIKK